jgi:hypothetical protein
MTCVWCGETATWVRDDDVTFCDSCKDDDDTQLVWWPIPAEKP